MAKWYLARRGGSPIGPLRTDALLRRIRGGTVAPETLVWSAGMSEWASAASVPEFSAAFGGEYESREESSEPRTVRVPELSPGGVPDFDDAMTVIAHEGPPLTPMTVPVIPESVLAEIPPESQHHILVPHGAFERALAMIPAGEDAPTYVETALSEGPRALIAADERPTTAELAPPSSSEPDSWRTVAIAGVAPANAARPGHQSGSWTRMVPASTAAGMPAPSYTNLHRIPDSEPPPSAGPMTRAFRTAGQSLVVPTPPTGGEALLSQTLPMQDRPRLKGGWPSAPPGGLGVVRPASAPTRSANPPPYPTHFPPPSAAFTPQPLPHAPPTGGPRGGESERRSRARVIAGAVFAVGLLVGVFAARKMVVARRLEAEERAAQDRAAERPRKPLYVPCFDAMLPDLAASVAGKEVPCGGGTLALNLEDAGAISLSLRGLAAAGFAAQLAQNVARVMPNLPAPSTSRVLAMRQLLRLDLRNQPDPEHRTTAAIKAYHEAELLVEGYEAMGGHRFARWLTAEGRLDAENTVTSAGIAVTLRFFPNESAPSTLTDSDQGHDGPEVAWNEPLPVKRVDPPYLVELRRTMMQKGWWFDDASAFMAAANTSGLPSAPPTAAGVAVVAEWLRTSDKWNVQTRWTIWNDCFPRRLNATPGGSRARYDEFAGVWRDSAVFVERPEYKTPEEEMAVYGRVFNASVGSPAHAYCATEIGRTMLRAGGATPETLVVRSAVGEARSIAESLIDDAKFPITLGAELVKVRSQLLKPGPPDL